MSGVNSVHLVGRLARDPEIKDANGIKIVNFCIVTSKQWKDDSGEKKETAEFHNCVAFRKTAELIGQYLSKGRQAYVSGELQTRSWDDEKSGTKKYKTEIVVNNVQFIGDAKSADRSTPSPEYGPEPTFNNSEEIPF